MSETFSGPPRFIMVGKKGPNNTNKFYHAPRDIRPVASLNHTNTLENISLIIAALFHEMPKRVPDPDKTHDSGQPQLVVDWASITSYIRYFGLVDLDMPLDTVLSGKESLIEGEQPREFKMDSLKQYWTQWLKKNDQLTVGEIRQHCKPFDLVCRDAEELVVGLRANKKPYVMFFSGCKGWRVLWYDPALFFWVNQNDNYASAYREQIATKYFVGLGCSPLFAGRLDVSVYDKNKGVKPDVMAHPDSGLFSWLLGDGDDVNSEKLVRRERDEALVDCVKSFWAELPKICPMTIPHLKPSGGSQPTITRVPRAPTEMTEAETPLQLLPEEFEQGILKWMKKQKQIPNLKSLPPHSLKPIGTEGFQVLTVPSWSYCAIAKRDHSAEKTGKVFFVINTIEVKQKCHSDKCRGLFEPVFTVEAEIQRRQESNKIALAINRKRRRDEQKQQEEEARRKFNTRSPSPDSRLSFNSDTSVGNYTTPQAVQAQREPEPRSIGTVEVDWFRYRMFGDRMACKRFYLQAFEGTEIYPLVVGVREGFELESSYILFENAKLAEAQNPETLLFVVVFDPARRRCAEWGYTKRKKIKQMQEDLGKSVLHRKGCLEGVTLRTCMEMFTSEQEVPKTSSLVGGELRLVSDLPEKYESQGFRFEGTHMKFDPERPDHVELVGKRIRDNLKVSQFFLIDAIQSQFHQRYKPSIGACEVVKEEWEQLNSVLSE